MRNNRNPPIPFRPGLNPQGPVPTPGLQHYTSNFIPNQLVSNMGGVGAQRGSFSGNNMTSMFGGQTMAFGMSQNMQNEYIKHISRL